MTVSRAY